MSTSPSAIIRNLPTWGNVSELASELTATSLDTSTTSLHLRAPGHNHKFRTMTCSVCGNTHRFEMRCKDRLCPSCAHKRMMAYARELTTRLTAELRRGRALRLMTLTTRYYSTLDRAYQHASGALARIRRHKDWKKYVDASVVGVEITARSTVQRTLDSGRRAERARWRVHFHILFSGRYFDQELLSESWRRATGDEYIVDIRSVYSDVRGAVMEMCKYPFKPADVRSWSSGMQQTYGTFIAGKRLLRTSGEWYGIVWPDAPPYECLCCGSSEWVYGSYGDGSESSERSPTWERIALARRSELAVAVELRS